MSESVGVVAVYRDSWSKLPRSQLFRKDAITAATALGLRTSLHSTTLRVSIIVLLGESRSGVRTLYVPGGICSCTI